MPKISNQLVVNTSQKVSLSQKQWFKNGASTLIMASMLFFVQLNSGGTEVSEAYIRIQKTSYLFNPDYEEKRLMSTEVNPNLTEFIADLEEPKIKDKTNSPESNDLAHKLKTMEDLEIRFTIHQVDPHFDPHEAKKRLAKLRSQIKDMSSDLDPDKLFKYPGHDTE